MALSFGKNNSTVHAFRTARNRAIDPATDDLGILGGEDSISDAVGINALGQVVGFFSNLVSINAHAFRTVPNSKINPITDDLGTLGGTSSAASGINVLGQVVGVSTTAGDLASHIFRTAPNSPINPATDDLGGIFINAVSMDDFGEVVAVNQAGIPGVYSNGEWHDLSQLIVNGSSCTFKGTISGPSTGINDVGQITTNSKCNGQNHAVLITPVYRAFVQQPINTDGSSVFNANRGVISVRFNLTQFGLSTCALPPATIAVTRAVGGVIEPVPESVYMTNADDGSKFRSNGCRYTYKLSASALGVGTYRIDISIGGIMFGHAVFSLQ